MLKRIRSGILAASLLGLSPAAAQIVDSGPIDTGANGLCETLAAGPDDVQLIPVGNGLPAAASVDTGPDGICSTPAAVGDIQVIPVSQGFPNCVCIEPGSNGFLDTTPNPLSDDVISGDTILTGPNGVCDTVASPQDDQRIPQGNGEPFRTCVHSGDNGVCQTVAQQDDQQLVQLGGGLPHTLCVIPGPNGIGNTLPIGDDVDHPPGQEVLFLRSDCLSDGSTNLDDAIYLLTYLFPPGGIPPAVPDCARACDIDDSGFLGLADPIVLLGYLFNPCLGNSPSHPFVGGCGVDLTTDALTCDSFTPCF